ncbi:M13 family metallopeptidase [Alteromonas gracilis]
MSILDDARAGMDPAVRPQDDLFGHVNGEWLRTAQIPSDRASYGPFVVLVEEAEEQVRTIIEECAAGALEGEDARKIGDLYTSFMDTERIERLGLEPVQPLLEQIDALSDASDLAAFMGSYERRGGGGVFGSYIDTDARDSDRYLLHLVQGGLGLPDEAYYREEKYAEIRERYVDYVESLLDLAGRGADGEGARIARGVLELETRLAQGHWDNVATRDAIKTYNLMTAAELKELLPHFDLDAWVRALGGSEGTIAEVVVGQPSYLSHLDTVIAQTPIDVWREWLIVKALRTSAGYLPEAFVQVNFDFYGRVLSGTPELRARWKRGVGLVEGALGEAVAQVYVARHFPPEAKAMMDDLVASLCEAYRVSIRDLDWMTEETKQRAYEKLDTFRPKIGYPERWRDYSALEIGRGDLLANVLASAAFETDRELRKIGSPVDRDEWFMLPQTVNAYYNPGTNEICFPAAILQPPFFSVDADAAENYGGIGAVIGHEMGHGFDDQGSEYDAHGNLNDWWTEADKAAFRVKADALIAQYDGLEPRNLPGEHVNGSLTVGENIGDLGGLTIAALAYRISLDGQEPPVVDGLTGLQRLFLNWAHAWRQKDREERARTLLAVDPHSPAEFRANIVRNLDEFHTAFETAPGDGLWLDPAERVRIW